MHRILERTYVHHHENDDVAAFESVRRHAEGQYDGVRVVFYPVHGTLLSWLLVGQFAGNENKLRYTESFESCIAEFEFLSNGTIDRTDKDRIGDSSWYPLHCNSQTWRDVSKIVPRAVESVLATRDTARLLGVHNGMKLDTWLRARKRRRSGVLAGS